MLVDIAVPCVIPDSVNVPSFGSEWGFVVAMHLPEKESAARVAAEWIEPSRGMMDALIGKSVTGGAAALNHYDGITHVSSTHLTKSLRTHMATDKRIITTANPIFMY